MMNLRTPLIVLFTTLACSCHAQQLPSISIWQGTSERTRTVTLTPYLPKGEKGHRTAVIVCPGGSYHWLDMQNEGRDVALWLNKKGIAAFVLRYRVAGVWAFATHYRLLARGRRQPDMLRDVQRSLQLVRQRAAEWAIDTAAVGVMGFSAGGHLALSSAMFAATNYLAPLGIVSRVSLRPNFVAALYPVVTFSDKRYVHRRSRKGFLGEWAKTNRALQDSFSIERHIPGNCPPVFFVHCDDDPTVHPANSLLLDSALTARRIPHRFIRYATGGHGFGASNTKGTNESRQWRASFIEWLQGLGITRLR